jgi:hypothetical protein
MTQAVLATLSVRMLLPPLFPLSALDQPLDFHNAPVQTRENVKAGG